MQPIGKYLIIGGLLLIILGVLFWLFGNKFNWLGNLPGDIKIEKGNFKFYFPVTSMLIVSIALSIIIRIVRRLF